MKNSKFYWGAYQEMGILKKEEILIDLKFDIVKNKNIIFFRNMKN